MLTPAKTEGRYVSIKADGKFHEVVSKETEGAVLREYELKDGTKGEKWELLYKSIDNVFITNVKFEDSDYGENILLTLSDGENEVIWSENTGSNFGSDLMKKLPNVDLAAKVSIKPYAFMTPENKEKKGVNLYQVDKLMSYFWDGEKPLHGIPHVSKEEAATYKTDDWKIHFINVKKFLTNYTKENIANKFSTPTAIGADGSLRADAIEYPEQEINPEDIPF